MANHKNAFMAIGESYSDKRISKPTDFTDRAFVGGPATGVLQYPLGLGGDLGTPPNWTNSKTTSVIPFTLFMPYKRKRGADALYSTMQNQTLFTQLPTPEFAVALPTPSSALKTDTTVEYNQFDVGGMIGGLVSQASGDTRDALNAFSTIENFGDFSTNAKNLLGKVVSLETGEALASLAGGAALNIAQALSKAVTAEETIPTIAGLAENPFTEFAFKNVQPRLHTFSYVFMPRSKEESTVIDRIINVFKYSMLPRPSSLAGFFQFPYEFQIVHSMQHTTFALLPSVLKACEIDYSGGTDSPKFFTKTDYPARITMNMQFQEVVLLNRDYVTKDEELLKADTDGPAANSIFRFRF